MESLNFTSGESFGYDSSEDVSPVQNYNSSFADIVWSALSTTTIFLIIIFVVTCIRVLIVGQKTRNPQQRRMYVGSRARPSLAQQEPSIFVSPSNLPPPPKYECMAPPSYEEVVGVHYPNYQPPTPGQPIITPITTALAQTSTDGTENRTETRSNDTDNGATSTVTVIRTVDETIVNVPRAVATSS